MMKRKYNRGRKKHIQWVFLMYDCVNRVGILELVPNRRRHTLIPIIKKHVRRGSHIISDAASIYRRTVRRPDGSLNKFVPRLTAYGYRSFFRGGGNLTVLCRLVTP